jgi:prepilin-type N-terminal cleavage/methylation domain-containing protein
MGYGRGVQTAAVRRRVKGRRGFTLAELIVALALSAALVAALYEVLRFQQRLHREERATISRHDALRLAAAMLGKDLMEARGVDGDLRVLLSDSLAVRSPVGFAVVCSVDSAAGILGLFDLAGRVSASDGDSALIYHPDGWVVRSIEAVNPVDGGSLACPYGSSGPQIEATVRVDASVAGVPVGAPLRTFHWYTYRLVEDGGTWWLARDDGTSVEILAGPLAGQGSGLAFAYFDSAGQPTTDPARIARVDVVLVAEDPAAPDVRDTLTAAMRLRNQ